MYKAVSYYILKRNKTDKKIYKELVEGKVYSASIAMRKIGGDTGVSFEDINTGLNIVRYKTPYYKEAIDMLSCDFNTRESYEKFCESDNYEKAKKDLEQIEIKK